MTQEQINEAIENCFWLSQNRGINLIEDVCTGRCLPCHKVIDSGKCPTLIELFKEATI